MADLIVEREGGLYCEAGDFHIDPWTAVDRAIVTHAHSDHARWGSQRYLTTASGEAVLRARLGSDAQIEGLAFGETINLSGVRVSLHPAGHILGSAQVRVEHRGEVWVVSGDYKIQADATCEPFEPLRCHTFITESTFGLPIYRWPAEQVVFDEVNAWWRANRERNWASVVLTYALGKAQRLLSGLDSSIGPIVAHGAVRRFLPAYASAGVTLPDVLRAEDQQLGELKGKAMVVAPPSVLGTPWLRKFAPLSTALASGWMKIRGARRRRSVDRGFILSDHADWAALLSTIRETGAQRIGVTHGYTGVLTRWLHEQGMDARAMATRYGEETEEETGGPAAPTSDDGSDSGRELLAGHE